MNTSMSFSYSWRPCEQLHVWTYGSLPLTVWLLSKQKKR